MNLGLQDAECDEPLALWWLTPGISILCLLPICIIQFICPRSPKTKMWDIFVVAHSLLTVCDKC